MAIKSRSSKNKLDIFHDLSTKNTIHYNIFLLITNASAFLCGIGISLPITDQALPPIAGAIMLLVIAIYAQFSSKMRQFRVSQLQLLRTNRIAYLSFALLIISGLPGTIFSAAIADEYLLRNFGAIVRLICFLIIAIFSSTLYNHYKINILKPIAAGAIASSVANIIDFFFGDGSTVSLAGQNPLGISISISYSFLLLYFFEAKGLVKAATFIGLAILGIAALLTWSKASWINVAVIVLICLTYRTITDKRKMSTSFLIIASVLAIAFIFDEEISRILRTEMSASEGSSSNEMRVAQSLNGLIIFFNYPFGIGNSTYPAMADKLRLYFPQHTPPDPHNAFVHILSAFGLFGFFFYSLIIIYIVYHLYRTRKTIASNSMLCLSLTLFSLLFQGLFSGEAFTQPVSWLILGFVLGVTTRAKIKQNEPI